MSTPLSITVCVEDLSRQFGRPTLGRTKYAVHDANGHVSRLCESMDEAEAELEEQKERARDGCYWEGKTEDERRLIRREFNRLPADQWEAYRTVSHYARANAR